MNILITGGFGYLGGRLARELCNQPGHEILLGSRRMHESPAWAPSARVVQILWHSSESLEDACRGVDAVVHLAGMNAQDCTADPVAALEANGLATARLLQAAIRQGVQRFLYPSTAHVYGSPLAGEINEQVCPVNLHPYATSHRAGEDVVRRAHACGDIEGVVIRLSNAFGAPAHKDADCWMLLVNDLCRQAVMTRRMVLRTSGLQRRDFISLPDACGAIRHLLQLSVRELGNGLYNVGGRSMPVIEMTGMIRDRCAARLGFFPEIVRPEPKPGEASPVLEYRTDKLRATGFIHGGYENAEIDATLSMCKIEWDMT